MVERKWEQHFRTGRLNIRTTVFRNLCPLRKSRIHQTLLAQIDLTLPHVRNAKGRLREQSVCPSEAGRQRGQQFLHSVVSALTDLYKVQ